MVYRLNWTHFYLTTLNINLIVLLNRWHLFAPNGKTYLFAHEEIEGGDKRRFCCCCLVSKRNEIKWMEWKSKSNYKHLESNRREIGDSNKSPDIKRHHFLLPKPKSWLFDAANSVTGFKDKGRLPKCYLLCERMVKHLLNCHSSIVKAWLDRLWCHSKLYVNNWWCKWVRLINEQKSIWRHKASMIHRLRLRPEV